MALESVGVIEIPDSAGTLYDHGAFEPKSRRVFVAHTARDRIEVIDHNADRHLATLPGFVAHAAGALLPFRAAATPIGSRRGVSKAWIPLAVGLTP